MSFEYENISTIQYELDNEKSECELKAVKLTMEGYRDEARYYDLIIKVYQTVSDMLDECYDASLDTFLNNLNNEYKKVRNKQLEKFHDLDDPSDSFIAGLYIETLDNLYLEVKEKIEECAK